jgi:hypothetical protein
MSFVIFNWYSYYVRIAYKTYNVKHQVLNWMRFLFFFFFLGINVRWIHHRRDYSSQGTWPKTCISQFIEKPSAEHCLWHITLPAICPLGIPLFICTSFCPMFLILLWTIINVIARKMGACCQDCQIYRRATTVSKKISYWFYYIIILIYLLY